MPGCSDRSNKVANGKRQKGETIKSWGALILLMAAIVGLFLCSIKDGYLFPIKSSATVLKRTENYQDVRLVWMAQENKEQALPIADTEAIRYSLKLALANTSLKGTDSDGDLREDENGNLVVESDVRKYFDYFLTLRGEKSPGAIRELFKNDIWSRVGPRARKRALELFDAYYGYLRKANVSVSGDNFEVAFENVIKLRREMLGTKVAQEFFASDERFSKLAQKRSKVRSDLEKVNALELEYSESERTIREKLINKHFLIN